MLVEKNQELNKRSKHHVNINNFVDTRQAQVGHQIFLRDYYAPVK